ncbi:protein S100-Z isoform X2 [Prionailurus viverrinus]|nr:protein S100-Z isoform X2 [Prionailurus viverrinus]XP_047703948.1 protein S100-Z isoform X2 [Prionailurus viverrinus]XP_047704017.1 protein S100-Z isoform X2 [Prionailurus viverrinus]
MPTQLEIAMNIMIRIFHQYSCKEGDRFKLNKGELKMLLQQELTEFLSCQKDPQLVDKIMQDLDANKDNEVDFNEFVVMVAALTVACNDYFVEQLKKKGKVEIVTGSNINYSQCAQFRCFSNQQETYYTAIGWISRACVGL